MDENQQSSKKIASVEVESIDEELRTTDFELAFFEDIDYNYFEAFNTTRNNCEELQKYPRKPIADEQTYNQYTMVKSKFENDIEYYKYFTPEQEEIIQNVSGSPTNKSKAAGGAKLSWFSEKLRKKKTTQEDAKLNIDLFSNLFQDDQKIQNLKAKVKIEMKEVKKTREKTEIKLSDIPKSEISFLNNNSYIFRPQILPSIKQIIYQESDLRKLSFKLSKIESEKHDKNSQEVELRDRLKKFKANYDSITNSNSSSNNNNNNDDDGLKLFNFRNINMSPNTSPLHFGLKGKHNRAVEKLSENKLDLDQINNIVYLNNENKKLFLEECPEVEVIETKSCCMRCFEYIFGNVNESFADFKHIWYGNESNPFAVYYNSPKLNSNLNFSGLNLV